MQRLRHPDNDSHHIMAATAIAWERRAASCSPAHLLGCLSIVRPSRISLAIPHSRALSSAPARRGPAAVLVERRVGSLQDCAGAAPQGTLDSTLTPGFGPHIDLQVAVQAAQEPDAGAEKCQTTAQRQANTPASFPARKKVQTRTSEG